MMTRADALLRQVSQCALESERDDRRSRVEDLPRRQQKVEETIGEADGTAQEGLNVVGGEMNACTPWEVDMR